MFLQLSDASLEPSKIRKDPEKLQKEKKLATRQIDLFASSNRIPWSEVVEIAREVSGGKEAGFSLKEARAVIEEVKKRKGLR